MHFCPGSRNSPLGSSAWPGRARCTLASVRGGVDGEDDGRRWSLLSKAVTGGGESFKADVLLSGITRWHVLVRGSKGLMKSSLNASFRKSSQPNWDISWPKQS